MTVSDQKPLQAYLDGSSLGNLLISGGILDKKSLDVLMDEFKELDDGTPLGQFLVSKKVLSPERLEFVLMKQDALRNDGVTKAHLLRAFDLAQGASCRVAKGMEVLIQRAAEAK